MSVLGWFKRGYVDITGFIWSTHAIRYGDIRSDYSTLTQDGPHGFNCNYMPIVADEQARKALAFMREGRRLRHVHEAYSFLSFFKVLESQFSAGARKAWVEDNLDKLDGKAAQRVADLRAQGINVNNHLYTSGRCAVAHASLGGDIVDPDVPEDRRRIRDDLVIIEALAQRYLAQDAGIPTEDTLYDKRDRVEPWHQLLAVEGLQRLKRGEAAESVADLGRLQGAAVSVRLWPHSAPEELTRMTLEAVETGNGWVKLQAKNGRSTMFLCYLMDVASGRMHTRLEEGGLCEEFNEVTEDDVASYTRYLHSVVGNGLVELCIDDADPVTCEVVIPVNIIPRVPEEAVAEAVAAFRQRRRPQTSTSDPVQPSC